LIELSSLIPDLQPWAAGLYNVALEFRLRPQIISTFRSTEEQGRLYRRYLRGDTNTPAAPPGRSLHNFGHAFDLWVPSREDQRWLGEVWEHWGGRWGGRFNDPLHFDTGANIT